MQKSTRKSKVKPIYELNTTSITTKTLSEEAAEVVNFVKETNKKGHHTTRDELNEHFGAYTEAKITRLTTLILNLLQYGWLKRQADPDNAIVYYWFKDFSSAFEPTKLADRPVEHPDLYALQNTETMPVSKTTPESTTVSKTKTVFKDTKLIDANLVTLLKRSQLTESQYQPAQKVKYGVLKIVQFLDQAKLKRIIEVAGVIGIRKRVCEIFIEKSKELDTKNDIFFLNESGISFLSKYESSRIQTDWLALVATNVLAKSTLDDVQETERCVNLMMELLKTKPM